jgi:hypothetical protein
LENVIVKDCDNVVNRVSNKHVKSSTSLKFVRLSTARFLLEDFDIHYITGVSVYKVIRRQLRNAIERVLVTLTITN